MQSMWLRDASPLSLFLTKHRSMNKNMKAYIYSWPLQQMQMNELFQAAVVLTAGRDSVVPQALSGRCGAPMSLLPFPGLELLFPSRSSKLSYTVSSWENARRLLTPWCILTVTVFLMHTADKETHYLCCGLSTRFTLIKVYLVRLVDKQSSLGQHGHMSLVSWPRKQLTGQWRFPHRGTRWRRCIRLRVAYRLRHYTTSRKVASSRPDELNYFFKFLLSFRQQHKNPRPWCGTNDPNRMQTIRKQTAQRVRDWV
jgi:hypothetical protein